MIIRPFNIGATAFMLPFVIWTSLQFSYSHRWQNYTCFIVAAFFFAGNAYFIIGKKHQHFD